MNLGLKGTSFMYGCLGGLVFGSAWLATEAFFHSLLGKVGLGAALYANFRLGGVPLVLLASAMGLVAALWASRWWPRLRHYLRPTEPAKRLTHAAAVVCLLGCGVCLALGTLVVGPAVSSTINTPVFAAAVLLVAQLMLLAIASSLLPFFYAVSLALLTWVARRKALAGLATPGGVLVAFLLLALPAAFFAIPSSSRAVLPWERLIGPTVGVLLATLVLRRWRRLRASHARWVTAGAMTVVTLLGILGVLAQPSASLDQVYEAKGVAVAWLPLVRPLLDVDGDGHLAVFGGRDCAAFDPSLHPGRVEVPNNGIDEDCSGTDLKLPEARVILGRTKYPVPPGLSKTPNIILVTADGLSYRHTSLGGYERPITPGLVALAKRATSFEHAFSTSSATDVSFPALMTGRYPLELPLALGSPKPRPFAIARPVATLAGELKRHGYHTVFIAPGHFFLQWHELLSGFDEVVRSAVDYSEELAGPERTHTGGRVSDAAIQAINSSDRPLFLWVHYFDMHWPYETPRTEDPLGQGYPVDKYDAEVRFADRQWSRVFEAVERRWLPADRLLIFTADHGEAFDSKHQENARHNAHLHTSEVRVPFIVQAPWRRGDSIGGLATHLDLWPTLANLLALNAPNALRGESLVPCLSQGKQPEKTVVYGFFLLPDLALGQVSVRTRNFNLLQWRSGRGSQLFRWQDDPLEDRDVSERDRLWLDWLTLLANQVVAQTPRAAQKE